MRFLTGKHRTQYEELQLWAQRKSTSLEFREQQIVQLKVENAELREQVKHERQRADNAVDALLATRGVPPISPSPPPPESRMDNPYDEDQEEASRMEKILASRSAAVGEANA